MNPGIMLLGTDAELEFATQSACELLGCEGGADLRHAWEQLRPAFEGVLRRGGGETAAEIEVAIDGRTRRLAIEAHPLSETRSSVTNLVVVRDRAHLEAFDTDLRLATQVRGMSRLYASLAHDLKAPLNAMVINLELLKDTLSPPAGPKVRERQRRYVGILVDEVSRLNRSLHTLLVHAAQPADAPRRFDLRELIEEILTLVGSQAKLQRVSVDARLPDTAVPVQGFRSHLKQAVVNVAVNALEAMPSGGQLAVALQPDARQAVLTLTDSGPGMPAALSAKLGTMRCMTKESGTGVGLYVARSVVASFAGTLSVTSTPGAGTSICISIPLSSEET